MAETLVDDEICAGQALLDVAIGSASRQRHVVGPPIVHARPRGHRGLRRHQRGQRLVVHGDQLHGVGQPRRDRRRSPRPRPRPRSGRRRAPGSAGRTAGPCANRRTRRGWPAPRRSRSAPVHTATAPGAARARSVATATTRACASRLRTTPRCRRPGRLRSSMKRPAPTRRRRSSLRRGEVPIIGQA